MLSKVIFTLATQLEVIKEMKDFYIDFNRDYCSPKQLSEDESWRSFFGYNAIDPNNELQMSDYEGNLLKTDIFDNIISDFDSLEAEFIKATNDNVIELLNYPVGMTNDIIPYTPPLYHRAFPANFEIAVNIEPNGHNKTMSVTGCYREAYEVKYRNRFQEIVGKIFTR